MKTLLLSYALAVATWALFMAAMALKPHLKTMRPFAKAHGYAIVALAVALDLVLNWIVASVVFWDMPWRGEWLLTARLKRYHKPAYAGSWRAKLAEWICTHLLDPFDPSGNHC